MLAKWPTGKVIKTCFSSNTVYGMKTFGRSGSDPCLLFLLTHQVGPHFITCLPSYWREFICLAKNIVLGLFQAALTEDMAFMSRDSFYFPTFNQQSFVQIIQ